MDSEALHTASTYLNNLLLARGLLRNSTPLDFAKPARDTRAHIINLVHDLLLKRDRDDDSRERAADALRHLRAESERKDAEIERLRTRLAEKEKDLATAQAETRAARADLKRVQTAAKTTGAQLAKSKTLAEQLRTQCLNDVRKRDAQIERLKTHIQAQQRGNKSLVVAPSMAISGGRSIIDASVHELQDPAYSLKQETNEFLTQLSQGLSDENDGLLTLVHATLKTLRGLLGVEAASVEDAVNGDGEDQTDAPAVQALAHERLSTELSGLLETLSGLLTNPNFVSVEEVDIRDEEISRLRDGWEKMEARWKDVLLMMDGWRRRLERSGGDSINLDDLKIGLGFGAGFQAIREATSPTRLPPRLSTIMSEPGSDEHLPLPSPIRSAIRPSALKSRTASPVKTEKISPPDFFDLRPSALRPVSENIPSSPRRVAFSASNDPPISTLRLSGAENIPTSGSTDDKSRSTSSSRKRISPDTEDKPRKRLSAESKDVSSSSFLEPEQPLSLAEKLRAAEIEAASASERKKKISEGEVEDSFDRLEVELNDGLEMLRSSPGRKTRIKGRPRRRKSTLSPEELESLLGME